MEFYRKELPPVKPPPGGAVGKHKAQKSIDDDKIVGYTHQNSGLVNNYQPQMMPNHQGGYVNQMPYFYHNGQAYQYNNNGPFIHQADPSSGTAAYRYNQPVGNQKGMNIPNKILIRASEIDMQNKRKEQEVTILEYS